MVISPLVALAKAHAVDVAVELTRAPKGLTFNVLKAKTELDSKTLARRLRELTAAGIVSQDAMGAYGVTRTGARAVKLARELGGGPSVE